MFGAAYAFLYMCILLSTIRDCVHVSLFDVIICGTCSFKKVLLLYKRSKYGKYIHKILSQSSDEYALSEL